MPLFITLIVMIVSQVHAYAQTHQHVYVKYMQLFTYRVYLNFKKKNTTFFGQYRIYLGQADPSDSLLGANLAVYSKR